MFGPVWWQLNGSLHQQGPGSDASTLRALRGLGDLPPRPKIADMGCGPGRQTLALARETDGELFALDLLRPFLDRLTERRDAAGLGDRVHAVCADMSHPPFARERFDLIWSEGAIYIPGFERGLSRWRELLRSGGRAAVTEISWVADAADETRAFWDEAYPAMADVDENRRRAERAGFEVLSTFPLPLADWHAYYDPIEARAEALRAEYSGDPDALEVLEGHREEVEVLERGESAYTYVFYLLRKA